MQANIHKVKRREEGNLPVFTKCIYDQTECDSEISV